MSYKTKQLIFLRNYETCMADLRELNFCVFQDCEGFDAFLEWAEFSCDTRDIIHNLERNYGLDYWSRFPDTA